MFKRIVTILTMIATSTLFLNEIARARVFVPSSTPTSIKERKRSCLPCAAAEGNSEMDPVDGLATLGRRTQIHPLTPLQRSIFDGTIVNLVSTATGHVAFAVTDLKINGPLPIVFQRAYTSDDGEDTGLGSGWSFVFDDRIKLIGDTATLSIGTGSRFTFRREGQSQHFVLKTDEPHTHQAFDLVDASTIVERSNGLTRTYKKLGSTYHLSKIADPNDNTITISFNSQERVSGIVSNSGGTLTLEWSDDKDARLQAVTDNSNRRIAFKQDGHGLRAVTDAAGAQWTYDYQGRRLTQATDPLGRILLRARYDKAGRVFEAGDAAGENLYEYDSASNDISRRTVVTDPSGAKTIFEHTERGLLSAISNDAGEMLLQVDYNAANRPTKIAGPLKGDTVFNYDAQNRMVNQASSDGAFQTYTYDERGRVSSTTTNSGRIDYLRDERGNVIQAKSDDPAQSYQAKFNSRGQTVSIKSEAGNEISFEYDASGNTSAFSTSKSGRFEIEADAVGRAVSRRLPSGALYRYDYDPRGMVVKQSDNKGRSMIIERDASGEVTGVNTMSGNWIRATRDEAGRIVALSTSSGKSRHFAYDTRGALADYTDARGQHKHFNYDKRGRLESVEGDDGNHTVIERDEKGHLKRIWSFNLPKGKHNSQEGRLIALGSTPGIPQFMTAGYGTSRVFTLLPQGENCWLDPADGFMNVDSGVQMGFDCSDPFGEFGGGGYGSFDPYFDPTGGTCVECTARQVEICAVNKQACLARLFQAGAGAGIACIGITISTVVGGLICIGFLVEGIGAGSAACQFDYQSCLLQAADKCPQCG